MSRDTPLGFLALLQILWKKKNLLIASVIFGISLATLYLKFATPIFESTTLIELNVHRPRIMGIDDAVIDDRGQALASVEHFNTELKKLDRPSVRAAVIKTVTDFLPPERASDEKYPLSQLVKEARLKLVRRSSIVDITAQSPDAEEAALIANAYAEEAVTAAFAQNKSESDQAVVWLNERARTQKAELLKTEGELLEYQSEHQLEIMRAERRALQEAILAYNVQKVSLSTELTLKRDTLLEIEKLYKGGIEVGNLPSSLPALDELRAAVVQRAKLQAEIGSSLSHYTEEHPAVVRLTRNIEAADKHITDIIKRSRQVVKADVDLLIRQSQSVEKLIKANTDRSVLIESKITSADAALASLLREKEALESSYRRILQRTEEVRLAAEEKTTSLHIIERAQASPLPVSPDRFIVLIAGLFLGGLIGVALSLGTHVLEDRIWSPTHIEQDLNQRILGIVPHAREGSHRIDLATISMTEKFSMVAESFGGIRGVLDREPQAKVILITSSTPAEGKTVSSCNLAIMSAKSGKKTLIVDLDMRRPQQRRVWDIPDTQADILNALSSPDDVAFATLPIETPVPGLEVIVSHSAKDESPAELLGSQRIADFIVWARQRYDRVIIDSPPLGSASDSMVLGGLVDGVILVTRFNKSKKGIARAGLRRLTDCGAQILGVIVNDVRQDNQKGYYGSFKSYYHGYHYAPYGDAEDKKEQRKARGKSWKSDLKSEEVA